MSRGTTWNTTNYLSATAISAYNIDLATSGLSIACWVKFTSTSVISVLMCAPILTDLADGYLFLYNSDGSNHFLRFFGNNINGGSGFNSTGTIADTTTWHHAAITLTTTSGGNTTYVFYIDGVAAGTAAVASGNLGTLSSNLKLGTDTPVASNGASVALAYVTMWNTTLSQASITALQTTSAPETVGTGCIAAWHLDTSALTDFSTNANVMAVTGTLAFATTNPAQVDSSPFACATAGDMVGLRWR
jgi:hypothetical protein